MREGKKGEWTPADPPMMPRGEGVCWSIFICAPVLVVTLLLPFVILIPRRLTLFCGWSRLSGVLVLYGTYRVQDNGMVQKAPIVMGCAPQYEPYEFVEWRRSLMKFLEIKVRSVLARCRTLGLRLFR